MFKQKKISEIFASAPKPVQQVILCIWRNDFVVLLYLRLSHRIYKSEKNYAVRSRYLGSRSSQTTDISKYISGPRKFTLRYQ